MDDSLKSKEKIGLVTLMVAREVTQVTWSLPGHLRYQQVGSFRMGIYQSSVAYLRSPSKNRTIPRSCVVINRQYGDKSHLSFDAGILLTSLGARRRDGAVALGFISDARCIERCHLSSRGQYEQSILSSFMDQLITIRRESSFLNLTTDVLLF